MTASSHVNVQVDLARIRQNTEAIVAKTGVEVIAVIKADAYGMGADAVAAAVGDLVDAFYVFDAAEVVDSNLRSIVDRRTLCLLGASNDPDYYIKNDLRPIVWTVERAAALKKAKPIVSLDTGQQRFGCAASELRKIIEAGECDEIMTHAITLQQVELFKSIIAKQLSDSARSGLHLHATGSSLLGDSSAWLNAVRPGLALYRDAARITTALVEVKDSHGPAGYTGFEVPRFGVILAGYSNGLRRGPCMINGNVRQIIEVGMQSAFVEVGKDDKTGDTVALLGDGLELEAVAEAWRARPQEVLVNLTGAGRRTYRR